jgi:puromycin-sensitive aminopeptidase
MLAPGLARTGWDAAPDETDDVRLRRAALVRGLVTVAREPVASAEAVARLDRFLGGDRSALEPNLHDPAVEAAARGGDEARFEGFRELFRTEKDPAYSRRYLVGLALFEAPSLSRRAREMALGGEVPLQDLALFAGALLSNRAAAGAFWSEMRAGWGPLEVRLAEAPLMLRRLIEGFGALTERRQLEELEAFFRDHPVPAARQGIAQTLEKLRLEVALWERIGPAVSAWLARPRGAA